MSKKLVAYDMSGANADNKMIFVRPAMWINFNTV